MKYQGLSNTPSSLSALSILTVKLFGFVSEVVASNEPITFLAKVSATDGPEPSGA